MARWTGSRIARLVAALFGAVGVDGPFPEEAVVREPAPDGSKSAAPDRRPPTPDLAPPVPNRPQPAPAGGTARPGTPRSASIDPQAEDRAPGRRA